MIKSCLANRLPLGRFLFALSLSLGANAQTLVDVSRQTKAVGPDLSVAPGAVNVIGIRGNTIPTLSAGCLQWSGSALVWGACGGGGGAVASVFGRTGFVTAASGDYSFSLISGSQALSQMNGGAPAAADYTYISSSTSTAIWKAIGSCSGASNALTYNTSTHAFGCNTISGGSGTPGGSSGQIQYNNAGAFGGDAGFTTDGAGHILFASANGTNTSVNAGWEVDRAISGDVLPTTPIAHGANYTVNADKACVLMPNGICYPVVLTIASGVATLGTSAISAGTCVTTTVSATGVAATDRIEWNPNGSLNGITGYVPGIAGGLSIAAYPTANNISWDICNWTSASITPGAVSLNYAVVR